MEKVKKLASSFKDPMIWIDCEMTGLDISKEQIIEIAAVVTDSSLEKIIEGPNLIINCSDKILNSMDEWCTEHHDNSGLTKAVKESKIYLADAEK